MTSARDVIKNIARPDKGHWARGVKRHAQKSCSTTLLLRFMKINRILLLIFQLCKVDFALQQLRVSVRRPMMCLYTALGVSVLPFDLVMCISAVNTDGLA